MQTTLQRTLKVQNRAVQRFLSNRRRTIAIVQCHTQYMYSKCTVVQYMYCVALITKTGRLMRAFSTVRSYGNRPAIVRVLYNSDK